MCEFIEVNDLVIRKNVFTVGKGSGFGNNMLFSPVYFRVIKKNNKNDLLTLVNTSTNEETEDFAKEFMLANPNLSRLRRMKSK